MSKPCGSLGAEPALSPRLGEERQAHEGGACEEGRRLRRTWATATCVCCVCCWRSCWRSCIWWWVDSGVPAPVGFEQAAGRSILGEAASTGSWGCGGAWRGERTGMTPDRAATGPLCNTQRAYAGVGWPTGNRGSAVPCPPQTRTGPSEGGEVTS